MRYGKSKILVQFLPILFFLGKDYLNISYFFIIKFCSNTIQSTCSKLGTKTSYKGVKKKKNTRKMSFFIFFFFLIYWIVWIFPFKLICIWPSFFHFIILPVRLWWYFLSNSTLFYSYFTDILQLFNYILSSL